MFKKRFTDEILKTNISFKEWISIGRNSTLQLFQNEEYGVRGDFLTAPAIYKKVDSKIVNDISIGSYLMDVCNLKIRFFIFKPNHNDNFKTFLYIMHEFPESQIDGKIVENFDRISSLPVNEIVKRNYAIVVFPTRDVAPDLAENYFSKTNNIFDKIEVNNKNGNKFGTLQAWSIAATRIMDYLLTLDFVDKKHVAIIGHSRGGKTALLAAAQDERFSLAVSSCSGCSGAAISRNATGETIEQILSNYPYWFCDNYKKYANNEYNLPFDQHQLLALIAPRHVYIFSADQDEHASPANEFLSCIYATPYFEMYDINGLVFNGDLKKDFSYNKGHIAYHIKTGNHCLESRDWNMIMDYFDTF